MSPLSEIALDDVLKKIGFEIALFPESNRRRFSSFAEMKQFFEKEATFWHGCSGNVHDISARFQNIGEMLKQAEEANSETEARDLVVRVKREASQSNYSLIYSETVDGRFLSDLSRSNGNAGDGAYDYLRGSIRKPWENRMNLDGTLKAFLHKNPDLLSGELRAERGTMEALRGEVGNTLDELMAEYRKITEEIKA